MHSMMKRIAAVILLMWVASALSQVERVPAHLHLGHVMTNWRDTPGNAGFLIAALSDAKVAVIHAQLAAKEENSREEIRLHVTHVLNALDSSIEPKGPGSGYGVKKAAAGALQHLGLAVAAEGATDSMKSRAARVVPLLKTVLELIDQAAGVAENSRQSNGIVEPRVLAQLLATLCGNISDTLEQAKTEMDFMMKDEGLENAPR
jgi:hypothetical protein